MAQIKEERKVNLRRLFLYREDKILKRLIYQLICSIRILRFERAELKEHSVSFSL